MSASRDDRRRASARHRRGNIINACVREFDASDRLSAISRLRALLDDPTPRPMIVSGDIDGLIAATMLHDAAPHWTIAAVIVKSKDVLLSPDGLAGSRLEDCFGVDVFSTFIPNVSNHVALWGNKKRGGSAEAKTLSSAYDEEVRARAKTTLLASPSLWAGIEGAVDGTPTAMEHRYPLGTAHVVLAMLEAIGRAPRFFDRDYLPWLVANCDGGLDTIRDHPHNVPMWWSSLAAAVGPSSISEQLYQLAMRQRPTEFSDIVNRLRSEGGDDNDPALALTDRWNLKGDVSSLTIVSDWIDSLSGWGDPFSGGRAAVSTWERRALDRSGRVRTAGALGPDRVQALSDLKHHFRSSLAAVHTNFADFDAKRRLNWVAAWEGAPSRLDSPPESLRDAGQSDG